jgi:hypothetical protein
MQIFDAIDLKYADYDSDERWADVQREIDFVRAVVTTVVSARGLDGEGLPSEVLASIRS